MQVIADYSWINRFLHALHLHCLQTKELHLQSAITLLYFPRYTYGLVLEANFSSSFFVFPGADCGDRELNHGRTMLSGLVTTLTQAHQQYILFSSPSCIIVLACARSRLSIRIYNQQQWKEIIICTPTVLK